MQDVYHVIGLMSGTSLDGLDLAFCRFENKKGRWQFELKSSRHVPYDEEYVAQLQHAVNLSALDLLELNVQYGRWLGEQVTAFIADHSLSVDFVASHGHTIYHQPDKGFTYQIGSGAELANACRQTVVCDFRSLDVTMGGQGAPLVPIGDQLLFPAYDFCLNLGGIANVSFLNKGKRVAYDIGLANMLLNHFANSIGLAYDQGGGIAAKGKVNNQLLAQLNGLDYYRLPYPKSIGYEWFVDVVQPLVDGSDSSNEDKMTTGVAHITEMIARAVLAEHNKEQPGKMLVTGGGAKNDFLIHQLKEALTDKVEVLVPEEDLIDFKEAIVFALMGVLKMNGEVNCLASVTGAKKDVSGGVIFEPQ